MQTINFTRGVPANESFPIDEVIAAAEAALRTNGGGDAPVRAVARLPAAARVARRVAGCAVDRVLTGNGSLQLIEFLCLRLLKPGDVVFTESPTYDRDAHVAAPPRRDGRRHPARGRRPGYRGARTRRSRAACRSSSTSSRTSRIPRARPARERSGGRSWSLPPGTASCSSKTRPTACFAIAAREEPTLYELAPERTLHMSSFTKLIAPGVRTGFMIGEPTLIAKLAKVAEDTYISPGYVAQGITYEWCRRGLLPPQIERLKTALRAAPRRLSRRRSTSTCRMPWRRGPMAGSSSRSRFPRA